MPMLKAERISCSDPKLSDAQTCNFEAIKHTSGAVSGTSRVLVGEKNGGAVGSPRSSGGRDNGLIEGMNPAIQSLKCASRGFMSVGYFTTTIFLSLGRLEFSAQLESGCTTH